MESPSLTRAELLQLLQRQLVPLYPSPSPHIPTRSMRQTRLHHQVGRAIDRVSSRQRLAHDVHHHLVLQLIPHAVARHHDKLVVLPDVERIDLRRTGDVRRVERLLVAVQQRNRLDERLALQHEVAQTACQLQHPLHVHRHAVVVFDQVTLVYLACKSDAYWGAPPSASSAPQAPARCGRSSAAPPPACPPPRYSDDPALRDSHPLR